MSCVALKCRDPCPGTCGVNAQCQAVNHLPLCTCIPGYTGNPFTYCSPIVETRKPRQLIITFEKRKRKTFRLIYQIDQFVESNYHFDQILQYKSVSITVTLVHFSFISNFFLRDYRIVSPLLQSSRCKSISTSVTSVHFPFVSHFFYGLSNYKLMSIIITLVHFSVVSNFFLRIISN